MVKAGKRKKKDRSGKIGKMRAQLAERQAELERAIQRERTFRKRTIRLLEGIRDALREANKHNYRFVCDIMAERLQRFIETEQTAEKLDDDNPGSQSPAIDNPFLSATRNTDGKTSGNRTNRNQ